METNENSTPSCFLKCLRNIEDISHSTHKLKYGVNTIGRSLNNDVVLVNSNVSRTHCHLRVEKKETCDIAYIKDLGTSNGTIVGNINLKEFEEHQLNDLDMIVLASGDEGVILQFIVHIDRTIHFSNLSSDQINYKRKVVTMDNSDEPTAIKIPKLEFDEPFIFKEPFPNVSTNHSNQTIKSENSHNIVNELQYTHLNQTISSSVNYPINQNSCQILPAEDFVVPSNQTEPSSSHFNDKSLTSVKIKTEPDIKNNILSQGTYRSEEDSVIVIYSSDEENDINENDLGLHNIKIEQQKQINLNITTTTKSNPSTSKVENNLNLPEWSIQCLELSSDDEDDLIYIPPKFNSNNNSALKNSSDGDNDYNIKCPEIIEPFPMKPNTRKGLTKMLVENEYIIKTRAKSEKKINNKKITEVMTADQNKQIIQERRVRLQQLAKHTGTSSTNEKKSLNSNSSTEDYFIDKPSTTNTLKKKPRISKLQQNDNYYCVPSTSKSSLAAEVENNDALGISMIKVKFNSKGETSNINSTILPRSSLNFNDVGSSAKIMDLLNFAYYDTLSKICKWNAVWLHEEKFVEKSPPLVKTINKMKGQFENPSEYSFTVIPLLLHEIWSKISESYNMILSKHPDLEKCIFEKSLKKDIPILTFEVQSVNKDFSTSVHTLKSISEPLWCLKCIETKKKNIENLTGLRFSLKGYLCIAIIQSKSFETDNVRVKKPTKSRNIFFAYVNRAKKNGFHSSTQLYIELIVTRKTENIPIGTPIHLMDIFYLHSELRLFQAVSNVITSSLNNALITTQCHNYSIDYPKSNFKNYRDNSLMLNNSQKLAVKMAVTICSSQEPNVGLIIGPPGTGKTNVICNIVLTLMSKLQTKANKKPKLLVCAPSNEAVDALVKRIIEMKKNVKHELKFSVVRVGNGQKYDPNSPIVNVMLDNLVKERMNNPINEQQCQTNALSILTNKKDIEKDTLENADVVVTTLNSCFSKSMEDAFMPSIVKSLNSSCHFAACIVDEAGQCIEPLTYVPVLLGIDKLILVGDDKQLQPVVKSKLAKDNGLGISLFKRLITWFEFKRCTRKNFPITMLDTQYRMHHEICSFPSQYFYKGVVKTAPSVGLRKKLLFQPYIILEHESQQDNSGEFNIGEANMIVNLVEIILDLECKSLSVAVLTPYHKQREQISILLKNKKISLNVNTIDSFQGGECDVLLISTVRTNGIGFMDDICRLNVALTRAKQSLIICGNFVSLKVERVWRDLLEDAKKRKLIKKVSKNVINNPRSLLAMIKY